MTLTLRAVSLNDAPLTQPLTAQFGAQGGTIGRADTNTLALPDPERHISRQQAEIQAGAAGFSIRNVGSANPITVAGQPLHQGQVTALRDRDEVRIGGYLLQVSDDGAEQDTALDAAAPPPRAADPGWTVPAPPPVRPAATVPGPASDPFADLLGTPGGGGTDPFADLFGKPASAPVAKSPFAQSHVAAPPAAVTRAGPALLPDDFDPFAAPPAPARSAPASVFDELIPTAPAPLAAAPTPRNDAIGLGGAFADLIPAQGGGGSLDELFGLGAAPAGNDDPLAGFMAEATRAIGDGATGGLSADPLALFGAAPAPVSSEPLTPALPDHTPALQSSFRPPEVRRPQPAASDPEPAPVAPPTAAIAPGTADTAALWRAFCEGAGIRLDPPQGLSPELMRVIGQLLHASVDGTLQMMAVRAATKHELRAQVTVIRARDNNPLKFSPDAQTALEQLLQPPVRGFLPGPAAMSDAMHDLVGHTIGSLAGTRAALEGVLGRFKPEMLEGKLTSRSVLDSVLAINRRAKLWDLYLQHFESIRDEAQEDFHTLFGKAFLEAYEEQLERLNQRRSAA